MSPTVLLADPSVRLAGVRTTRARVRVARRRPPVRWRWLVAAWLVAAAVCGLAFLGTWPPLATVMSGSMAPTIDTGDIVLLKRLDRPARRGDIVSIPVPDEARSRFGYPPVVIHRIVAIDRAGVVTTKGDARKQPDPFTVPTTTLTTRVVATIPAAGRVLAFLVSPLGLLWLVGGAVLLIGMPLLERYRDAQRRAADDRDGVAAALAAVTAELAALRDERAYEHDRAWEDAERTREAAAAEAAQAREAAAAEVARAAAEAAQAREAAAAEVARAAAEAAQAREDLRAVSAALTRHLDELPALIERAIADAFASAAPAPPPPPPPPAPARPIPAPAALPTRAAPSRLVPARAATPDLLGGFAKPPAAPTPDLLAALKPAVAWDSPPRDLATQRRFVPPVKTFFA